MPDKDKEQMGSDKKPKKDPATLAMENNPCGLCRYKSPVCRGHAPSGGGGSGSGQGSGGGEDRDNEFKILNANEAKKASDIFYITKSDDGTIKVVDYQRNDLKSKELESKILLYNFQELFKQQLEIKSNFKDTLTIKIRSDLPNDQKEVLQEFLTLLKKQCDSLFLAKPENELLAQGYNAKIDEKNGELKIYIPDQKLFRDLIKDLSKNSSVLFEQAKQKRDEKQHVPLREEKTSIGKTPNPFSTKLEKK